jgi:hypothetical protein
LKGTGLAGGPRKTVEKWREGIWKRKIIIIPGERRTKA